MAVNFSTVQTVKFYEFGSSSYLVGVVFNKQWDRHYLEITRKYKYNKDGQETEGSSSTYLNLSAAAALLKQLPTSYQLAKDLQENLGLEIY